MSFKINIDEVAAECKASTPGPIIKIMAENKGIAAEALKRVEEEGTVVRNLKGDVIAHPGIKVHADASNVLTKLYKEWGSVGFSNKLSAVAADSPEPLPAFYSKPSSGGGGT